VSSQVKPASPTLPDTCQAQLKKKRKKKNAPAGVAAERPIDRASGELEQWYLAPERGLGVSRPSTRFPFRNLHGTAGPARAVQASSTPETATRSPVPRASITSAPFRANRATTPGGAVADGRERGLALPLSLNRHQPGASQRI